MKLPGELQRAIEARLSCQILSQKPLRGGSIHHALQLQTSEGLLFVKWNQRSQSANFNAEAQGLERLRATKTALHFPQVLAQVEGSYAAALVLEYVAPGSSAEANNFWQTLGQGLAALHQHSAEHFGLDHTNYIGSLPQSNRPHTRWSDFFVTERLEPMQALARNKGLLSSDDIRRFEQLQHALDQLIPAEAPALLHGDLWSGNLMTGPQGQPWLIDPAIYYGHREADLAFTRLFGGFAEQFYRAYQQAWPLQEGWQQRVRLFNLYPLLVHLNLFGASYHSQIQDTLRRFT